MPHHFPTVSILNELVVGVMDVFSSGNKQMYQKKEKRKILQVKPPISHQLLIIKLIFQDPSLKLANLQMRHFPSLRSLDKLVVVVVLIHNFLRGESPNAHFCFSNDFTIYEYQDLRNHPNFVISNHENLSSNAVQNTQVTPLGSHLSRPCSFNTFKARPRNPETTILIEEPPLQPQSSEIPHYAVSTAISENLPNTPKSHKFDPSSTQTIHPPYSFNYVKPQEYLGFGLNDSIASQSLYPWHPIPSSSKNNFYSANINVAEPNPLRKTSHEKCIIYSCSVIGTFLLMLMIITVYFLIFRNHI
uniref:Low-density lipoprotein receptor-related protein 6 n=1 Tax=Lygus hesperus TaxID=30085 RepID=A0A0A9X3X4_LYGHE